jgi:putative spermidine/putrescine transport system substrate-binding protein
LSSHSHRPPHRRIDAGHRAGLLAVTFGAALCGAAAAAHAQDTLSVATWGGAYGRAQEIALFEPFARKTGTAIATEIYDGSTAKLKAMIEGGGTPVDVVDVSAGTLDTLCKDGLLETVEASSLDAAPDGASAGDDFLSGGVTECGVASVAWSTAVAFDRKAFAKGAPTQIGALLDTAQYPGKRGLPNNPRYTLELALLADGVPPGSVYSTLATPEGVDRAFAALAKIKDHVLLWDKAEEPITWLLEDKVAMAAGYTGRIFRAAVGDRNVGVLWDGQIYDIDAWAVPKASDNKEEAMRFIRFATAPEQIAAQARLTAYGPMRKSAVPMVGKHPIIDVEMQAFLPTAPENFQNALKFDEAWWSKNGAGLDQRFAAWRAEVEAAEAAREAARKAKEAAEQEATPKASP